MTEKNLINLGFKKVEETAENSDYKKDWYYYTYDLIKTRYPLVLISYDNEVAKNNGWYVYIADYEDIMSYNYEENEEYSSNRCETCKSICGSYGCGNEDCEDYDPSGIYEETERDNMKDMLSEM